MKGCVQWNHINFTVEILPRTGFEPELLDQWINSYPTTLPGLPTQKKWSD